MAITADTYNYKVIHIMNDGSILTDISGHVVKMNEAAGFYQLLDRLNAESRRRNNEKKKEKQKAREQPC